MSKKVKISELVPDDKNYNKGTEFGDSLLDKSLRNYGAGRSILLDKNNRIIAGNKTAQKAGEIGLEDVQIIESDGTKLIAVKRTDIDLDSEAGRELALADNAVSKVNLEWDEENLKLDFELKELEEWGIHIEEPEELKEEESETPEAPKQPQTVLGDLYELVSVDAGITHRVQCGDSCDSDVVKKLTDRFVIDFVHTDPPYGMNAVSKSGVLSKNYSSDIKGDDDNTVAIDSFNLTYSLFECPQVWWGANYYSSSLPDSECWLVWDKNNGESDQTDAELAWTNFRSVVRKFTQASEKTNRVHPTQKPASLVKWVFDKSKSEIRNVYDPFLGSGTTLIACEQLGRVCYGQELDEKYMDVIVQRWVNYMKDAGKEYKVLRNGEECIDFD